MVEDVTTHVAPTRREYVKYSGAVVGGSLLAGCTGDSESASTPTETNGHTDTTAQEPTTQTEAAYEVCMKPNGCHTLETVPEKFIVYHQGPVDMMISLGQADDMVASGMPSTFPTQYFDQLPGVSVNLGSVTALNEDDAPDKEVFYELDVDVHLVGHHPAMEYFNLDEADLAELEENVAPFHGSWMRRPDYTDGHPYYGLYEGLDKYAEVFKTEARGEAFRSLHDEVVERVTSQYPPVEERPSIAYLNNNYWKNGQQVFIRNPSLSGYQTKALRDLEIATQDAFTDRHPVESSDMEILLEVDPEVIIYHTGLNVIRDPEKSFQEDILSPLQEDPVVGEVTAIKEGRVLPWHEFEQGPVINLFNIELLAKGLYPEQFGEPTGMEAPPEDEQLFDRQRVADIITGDI